MSAEAPERRQGNRQPICLPVKVAFPDHRAESSHGVASSAGHDEHSHALAIDASSHGLQIEISGSAARRLREAADMQPRLELRFVHAQLSWLGARAGRVRWSRADGHGAWRVGVQLDEALSADALALVLTLGRPAHEPPQTGRSGLLAALAVVAASGLWLPLYLSARSDRDQAMAHALMADDAADRARSESLACVTERAGEQAARATAMASAVPVPSANAAPPLGAARPVIAAAADEAPDAAVREALVRGLVEQAFRAIEDAGDAAPLATTRDADADDDR